jgi:cell division protein FtsI (penicillin-binding protein 3)
MEPSKPSARWFAILVIGALWTLTVTARLGWLQLVRYSTYLGKARHQQEHLIEISPERGVIYDRNGRELAISTPVDSCFANPNEITDPGMVASLLAPILKVPEGDLLTRLQEKKSFVWIERKLPPQISQRISGLDLRGIYLQKETERFYPQGTLAAHALGYVDTDGRGLGGIEYEYDKQIRGRAGHMLVLEDAHRRWLDRKVIPAAPGASVVLTIDENIQYIAEKELDAEMVLSHAKSGVVLVQNPANGEILALASWPTFDPNHVGNAPTENLMDRAVTAAYEPGSTFKLITLAGALQEKITTPEEVVDCQMGKIMLAGRLIHDHKPFGLLTVADVLAKSSDIGAIKIGLRLGPQRFYQHIRDFGFGEATGIELPGENPGLLRRVENWTASSIGSLAMGQEISVNPLQLVSAVSSIANGGMLYKPRLVKEIRRVNGVETISPPEPQRDLSATTAATVRNMMEGVVLTGTAKSAQLAGYSVAGKTGTAQKIDPATGRYSATQYIASFVGFAPVNNPPVTVLVVLDSPVGLHMGGDTAAPLFKRVMEQILAYLGVPHDQPLSPQQQKEFARAGVPPAAPAATEADLEDAPGTVVGDSGEPASNSKDADPSTVQTAAFNDGSAVAMPNFAGRSVRDVTESCLQLGLNPVLIGNGIAAEQSPEPGTQVPRGGRVTIHFFRAVFSPVAARENGR